MSTPGTMLLAVVGLVVVPAAAEPSEGAAEAIGQALGSLLLSCGIGYLVVRRAR